MSILSKLFADADPGRESSWDGPGFSRSFSSAGMRVSPESALTVSAVFAAVRLLSDVVASLPLIVYRTLSDDGGKERARNHPLYDVLHSTPNTFQDSFTWRRIMMKHILLRGAGYNFIVPGARGFADQLVPIDPDRVVKTTQIESGRLVFSIKEPGASGRTRLYTQDEVFRICGWTEDGINCQSVLSGYARESVGLAIAQERYAATLFGQGAMHGGALSVPGVLNDEAADRMARSFQKATSGSNNWHRPVVLEQGATWKETTMTAEDSQFILSRRFSVTEIARWFGVPPHMIGDLERSTNNNIEQQSLEFVIYNLTPWLSSWEHAVKHNLILERERDSYFAEFNIDGLLRGDSESRANFFTKMFAVGAYSTNDIRRIDSKNAIEGGDQRFIPANMSPLIAVEQVQPLTDIETSVDTDTDESDDESDDNAIAAIHRANDIVIASAERVLRKETSAASRAAVKYAANADGFAKWATEFYESHVTLVTGSMCMNERKAQIYCECHRDDLIAGGLAVVNSSGWSAEYLALIALDVHEETDQ
jgi:HK97 family phage portal protein